MKAAIVAASLFAAAVSAHGNVTSPPARLSGPAMAAACGQAAVDSVEADGTIPLESITPATTACKLDLCRGATFDDNKNQVQTFQKGQLVQMTARLDIPHEGPMNVSIVKTATNTAVGDPLLVFDTYADESLAALPANNTAFSITIPNTLAATDCLVPGECVVQWFWFGTAAKQTYESCVDFVIGGTTTVAATSATNTTNKAGKKATAAA